MVTGQRVAVDDALSVSRAWCCLVVCGDRASRGAQTPPGLSAIPASYMRKRAGGHTTRRNAPTNRHRVRIGGQPQVAFLNEPPPGSIPGAGKLFGILVAQHKKLGMPVVDHAVAREADALSDRIILIDHGIIIAEGTANELQDTAPASPSAK